MLEEQCQYVSRFALRCSQPKGHAGFHFHDPDALALRMRIARLKDKEREALSDVAVHREELP